MIIIADHTFAKAGKRDATVKAFNDMLERARKHDGCLDLSISADPVDADRIIVGRSPKAVLEGGSA